MDPLLDAFLLQSVAPAPLSDALECDSKGGEEEESAIRLYKIFIQILQPVRIESLCKAIGNRRCNVPVRNNGASACQCRFDHAREVLCAVGSEEELQCVGRKAPGGKGYPDERSDRAVGRLRRQEDISAFSLECLCEQTAVERRASPIGPLEDDQSSGHTTVKNNVLLLE